VLRHLPWLALILAFPGCDEDSDGSRRPRSRPGPQRLELAGVEAEVPADWEPLPRATRDRLMAAATQRDPGAQVALEGARPPGAPVGLALMHVRHDPAYGEGFPVSEAATDAEDLVRLAAQARGIEVESEHSCAERSCDIAYTLEGPGLVTTSYLRIWRDGGRLVEVGCQCMKTPEVDACAIPCELPMAPASATLD